MSTTYSEAQKVAMRALWDAQDHQGEASTLGASGAALAALSRKGMVRNASTWRGDLFGWPTLWRLTPAGRTEAARLAAEFAAEAVLGQDDDDTTEAGHAARTNAKAAAIRARDDAEAAARWEREADPADPLAADETVPAGQFDPALTYYADGARVVVADTVTATGRVHAGRIGTAAGRVKGAPYDFQRVQWDDGTADNVAPHVLRPADVYVPAAGEYAPPAEQVAQMVADSTPADVVVYDGAGKRHTGYSVQSIARRLYRHDPSHGDTIATAYRGPIADDGAGLWAVYLNGQHVGDMWSPPADSDRGPTLAELRGMARIVRRRTTRLAAGAAPVTVSVVRDDTDGTRYGVVIAYASGARHGQTIRHRYGRPTYAAGDLPETTDPHANPYVMGDADWHAWGHGFDYGQSHDYSPEPLSGEWAGGPSPADVIRAAWRGVFGETWDTYSDDPDARDSDDDVTTAWEAGALAAWELRGVIAAGPVVLREHAPWMMGQGPRATYVAQEFPNIAAARAWFARAGRKSEGYTYTLHTLAGERIGDAL